jgi:hypothetical protein
MASASGDLVGPTAMVGRHSVVSSGGGCTAPGAQPENAVRSRGLSSYGFSLGILLVSLVLQRFAFPAGGTLKISFATPLGFGLALWGLTNGSLVLDRRRMGLMLGLGGVALLAYSSQTNIPLAIAPRSSVVSCAYWLAVTGFAALRFAEPMDETRFFRLVNRVLVWIAVAGVLQFAAQLVGVKLFAFKGILPGSILIEEQFHVAAPFAFGLMRANGFFLVEPSTYAQFMAAGIIIEILYFRRYLVIGILFTGIFLSASGTGWLVLGSFVIGVAFTNGRMGIVLALVTAALIAVILVALSIFLPNVVDGLFGRVHEFTLPGTSGYERFVTPFMLATDVFNYAPFALLTGIGPGASIDVQVPYVYGVNAPIKIMMEYGIFGLLLYLMVMITALRTPRQRALVIPMMCLLLFSGGNQLFSPILFPVFLLITIANLAPNNPAEVEPSVRTGQLARIETQQTPVVA